MGIYLNLSVTELKVKIFIKCSISVPYKLIDKKLPGKLFVSLQGS